MAPESKLRIRTIAALLSTILVAGAVVWLLLWYGMPQYYFRFYPLIPIYFTVLGVVVATIMWRHHRRMENRSILNMYMVIRVAKLLLTLGVIGLYYVIIDERTKEFCLTAAVFYFLYLFVETYLLYRFEKLKKQIR